MCEKELVKNVKMTTEEKLVQGDDDGGMQEALAQRLNEALQISKMMVKLGKLSNIRSQQEGKWKEFVRKQVVEHFPSASIEALVQASILNKAPLQLLRAATFNLFGVGNHWQARHKQLSQLFDRSKLHVVALQEVRVFVDGTSQLELLHQNFEDPNAWHSAYQQCTNFNVTSKKKKPDLSQGLFEGLALLSRFPIISQEALSLPVDAAQSDKNRRCVLSVVLDSSSISQIMPRLQVVVIHLSYDQKQQCQNVVALRRWMDKQYQLRGLPQMLLGDFNMYANWEWPMDVLTHQSLSSKYFASERYMCKPVQLKSQLIKGLQSDLSTTDGLSVLPLLKWNEVNRLSSIPSFKDVWTEVFGRSTLGFTFSNALELSKLWDDNPPSRPDRILYRAGNSSEVGLVAFSADVLGSKDGFFESLDTTTQLSDHLGVMVHFGVMKATQDTVQKFIQRLSQVRPPKPRKMNEAWIKKAEKQIESKVQELLVALHTN